MKIKEGAERATFEVQMALYNKNAQKKYPNNKQFLQLAGMEMFIRNEITAGTTSKPQSITTEVEVVDV